MNDPRDNNPRPPDGLARLLAPRHAPTNAAIARRLKRATWDPIAAKDAVALYLHHPSEVPGELYIAAVPGHDARGAVGTYSSWEQTLIREAQEGRFLDVVGLHAFSVPVLRKQAWKHRLLSWHRDNPLSPSVTPTADDPADDATRRPPRRRLFVTGLDLTRFPAPTPSYEEAADRFTAWLRIGREAGRDRFRAAVLYLRTAHASRTTRGVAARVARRAVVTAAGRVVGFVSRRTPPADTPPENSVVKQTRAICHHALVAVQVAAVRLGYGLLPGW